MSESDLTSYQSYDTAWRYDLRMSRCKQKIADIEEALKKEKLNLHFLESNPPLYEYFNWSA